MTHRIILSSIVSILLIFSWAGCSDDDTGTNTVSSSSSSQSSSSSSSSEPAELTIVIQTENDSGSAISNAYVILYNADSNEPLESAKTGTDGSTNFIRTNAGNFYVTLAAQGYNPIPSEYSSPVPFEVGEGETITNAYTMNANNLTDIGWIEGHTDPAASGATIIATNTDGESYSTISGPDGYFALFNMPYNDYTLNAYMENTNSIPTNTSIDSLEEQKYVTLVLQEVDGSTLSGEVSFLAIEGDEIDITMLDRSTMTAIAGLTTKTTNTYSISNIPAGSYKVWASYKNDGFVIDPWWLANNPGALDIDFPSEATNKTLDFSVTEAVYLTFPTNPTNSLEPLEITNTNVSFFWHAYPSAAEYIIEVRDSNGNLIWGGYDHDTYDISHANITGTNVEFNFDDSATTNLVKDMVYQWKIYADSEQVAMATLGTVDKLISVSEIQHGLFIIK